MNSNIVSGIFGLGSKLLDRFIPDPAEREKAKLALLSAHTKGDLQELELSLGAIIAEANSDDKWTSRARPSFLYMFYLVLVVLVLVAPVIGVFYPDQMTQFYTNVALGFKAIPEPLWWTFTTGYLGYTGAREYGKHQQKKLTHGR